MGPRLNECAIADYSFTSIGVNFLTRFHNAKVHEIILVWFKYFVRSRKRHRSFFISNLFITSN